MRVARTVSLLLLVTLSSCPGGTPSPRRPGATQTPGVRGGTLRVLLAEDVDSLDPQRAGRPPAFGFLRAMHRGLMAFPAAAAPQGASPVPDLAAAEPDVSADGLHYTFLLRDGIAFGPPASRAITAADVKASLERIAAAASPLAHYFQVIAGVTAPAERTVEIALTRPANDLAWMLALPAASVVPAGLAAAARPAEISAAGPYRLADDNGYVPERSIHLVRNDAWKEDSDAVRRAWVDEIRVDIGLDPAEIQRRLADGRADLSGDVPPTQPPTERVFRAPNGCLRYLFLNTRVAPFSSSRVRTAVVAAVDRAAVAAAQGSGTAAATILPPTVDGYDPALLVPRADPADARRRLAAVGYARGFATRLVVGSRPADLAEAAALRTALARAGIRVSISPVAIALLYEDRYEVPAARVPMGIATWCADWPGLGGRGSLAPLVDGRRGAVRGTTDYSGFNDAALDAAMDAAAAIRDPARAAAAWRAADARAVGAAAVVPLAHLTEVALIGPRVRGYVAHPYLLRGDLTAIWLENG